MSISNIDLKVKVFYIFLNLPKTFHLKIEYMAKCKIQANHEIKRDKHKVLPPSSSDPKHEYLKYTLGHTF